MANRNKQQGTAWEREVRQRLTSEGIQVRRLAEEGINDLGDLQLDEHDLIIECKDAAALNLHGTLAKATRKASQANARAVVAWKRKERKQGNTRRTQVGEPLVAMPLDLFIRMLKEIGR